MARHSEQDRAQDNVDTNDHEPECVVSQGRLHPVDRDSWRIEIDVIPGKPVIAHAINMSTGNIKCFVAVGEESPAYTPIGELFAMVRDNFDKA